MFTVLLTILIILGVIALLPYIVGFLVFLFALAAAGLCLIMAGLTWIKEKLTS